MRDPWRTARPHLPPSDATRACRPATEPARPPPCRHRGGGRWTFDPSAADLAIEQLNPKDQYETPAQIWRHAIATFGLTHDAHASSLNAVLPAYSTRGGEPPPDGARLWLNPAFGTRCSTIGETLAAHVWQRGCAVVAFLPALLHTDWCAAPVVRPCPAFSSARFALTPSLTDLPSGCTCPSTSRPSPHPSGGTSL